MEEVGGVLGELVEARVRDILGREFVNVGDEIEGIKEEMFRFMD